MNQRRSLLAAFAAALLLPLAACSALPGGSSSGAAPTVDGLVAPESMSDLGGAERAADGSASVQAGKSIISTGWVSIRVDDPSAAADEVSEIAESLDGYVESLSMDQANERGSASASVTLRIPADRFDDAFAELGEVGEVTSESRSAMDVTTEHVDLQARVAALEASVERLTELMEGAASTSDLIAAEAELSLRQQELDGLRAQLKALEGQVDYATVQVNLGSESVIPGGPSNFWEGLLAGLDSLVTAGAGLLVVLGILLPWLVIAGVIAIAVVLIVRGVKRRRNAKKP